MIIKIDFGNGEVREYEIFGNPQYFKLTTYSPTCGEVFYFEPFDKNPMENQR